MHTPFVNEVFLWLVLCIGLPQDKPSIRNEPGGGIHLDTSYVRWTRLVGGENRQEVVCRLKISALSDPICWSQTIVANRDTLITFAGQFAVEDFDEQTAANASLSSDSLISRIVFWFVNRMPLPTSRILENAVRDDPAFRRFSVGSFRGSLGKLGYSTQQSDKLNAAFWRIHEGKPVTVIHPPVEPVEGGNEGIYVYIPEIKRIVELYRP